MNSTHVLVKNKKTGEERTISYRSYIDTAYMFILLGQIDEKGNLIEGSPNLTPEHRQMVVPVKRDVAPVVDSGIKIDKVLEAKVEQTKVEEEESQVSEVKPEPKKRGPKPKLQEA